MDFKKLLFVSKKEENAYAYLSILAPIAVAIYIAPQDFPDNELLLTIYVISYTLIFNVIYRIYLFHRNKIRYKVIRKLAPTVFKRKDCVVEIKAQLESLKEYSNSNQENRDNTSIISDIINRDYYSISKKYATFIKMSEQVEQKIKDIADVNLNTEMNIEHYKKFDFLLMFTASFIFILRVFPDLFPSFFIPINSIFFAYLFLLVIVIYTFFEYSKYAYFLVITYVFIFLIPISISRLEKQKQIYLMKESKEIAK